MSDRQQILLLRILAPFAAVLLALAAGALWLHEPITATLLAALALEDTEENRARVIKAVDDCPIPIFIPTHRVGDPETEHDEEYHYPAGEDVKGAFMALEHPLD